MIIGYARVSTIEQNLDRQIKTLKEFGCEYIVKEKKSAANIKDRFEFRQLMDKLRFHDVLVVSDLSRMARSLDDLLPTLKYFKNNDIEFVSIKEGIDTRRNDIYSDLMIQIMGAIAQFERSLIKERQKEGIHIAKQKGKFKGRPIKYHENSKGKDKLIYDTVVNSLENNETVMDIHRKTGLSRTTVYKIKNRWEKDSNIN